jgi:hypothetical protein
MMRNLLNAALSMVIQRYMQSKPEEADHKLQRLQRALLRIDSMVEEYVLKQNNFFDNAKCFENM